MNAAGVTNMVHSTVLDIGAGDGTITDEMKEVFCSSISVTEKSRTMRQTLRRKGYTYSALVVILILLYAFSVYFLEYLMLTNGMQLNPLTSLAY